MKHAAPLHRIACALIGLAACSAAGMAAADVVVVVSARSPLVLLSRNQVMDIFLGHTSRFPNGTPAMPLDHAEGSATRDEFYLRFAGKSPAQLNAHWSRIIFTGKGQPPREIDNAADLRKRVADNPDAIGYLERTQVDGSVKVILSL